ncbi:NifU family protein [Mycobacterium sp. AMU20-3851]|uniref:NifU family protein n=1 Tax=Mycobacterium sp. AMU20-3851 TaxID=3122055 RepID=UPI003754256A
MDAPGPSPPAASQDDAHWRAAGERIQALLDASTAGGAAARERAELLVGEITDLYGAALQRIIRMADDSLTEDFAADDLIASLLLVHGLHPHDTRRRIEDALTTVRPYLGSHGGDITLIAVEDTRVRLRFAGSCKSCPSSAVTLELAVEEAIRAAAPEVSAIEVAAADTTPGMIPAESLLSRVHRDGHNSPTWHPAPELTELRPGEVGGFRVAGAILLACRVGEDLFAYRDRCGRCGGSLAGAALHRRTADAHPVLRCPRCRAHFDVVHAGTCVDDADPPAHLDPVPLLMRDGVLSLAVPAEPTPAGVP